MPGSETRQRNKSVLVRLTEEERAKLEARAQEAGLSVGAFVRKAALGSAGPRIRRAPVADTDELRRLRGELGKIGNNINQLAPHLNAGESGSARAVEETLAELRGLFPDLREALGHDR